MTQGQGLGKPVAVVCGNDIHDTVIMPGTTAREVLSSLGLGSDYGLSPPDGLFFAPEEVIYDQISAGAKLYASAQADVGAIYDLLTELFGDGSHRGGVSSTPPLIPQPGLAAGARNGRSPVVVQRRVVPLHVERGWTRRGNELHGYYRTRRGTFRGKITDPSSRSATYYIFNPPKALLEGPHGACFREVIKGMFKIHWNKKPGKDPSAGIRWIEHHLLEVLL